MDSSVSAKDEIWFLRGCHHVSNALYPVRFVAVALSVDTGDCSVGVASWGRRNGWQSEHSSHAWQILSRLRRTDRCKNAGIVRERTHHNVRRYSCVARFFLPSCLNVLCSIWNSFARVPRTIVGKSKGKVRCTLHRTEPKRTGGFLYLLVVFSELFHNQLDSAPLKQVIWSPVSRPKGIFKKLSKLHTYLKEVYRLKTQRMGAENEANRHGTNWPEAKWRTSPPPTFVSITCRVTLNWVVLLNP